MTEGQCRQQKSRSSNIVVKFQGIRVLCSFTVCCITQSLMTRNKKPDTHYPCSTPVITGKGAVISLSSITEHWKSEIGQYVLIMIIIKTTLHVVAFTQDIYLLH